MFSPATTTMTSLLKPSPGRRRGSDLESGKSENADSDSDTFYIPGKNASIERLQQWRVRPSSFLASVSCVNARFRWSSLCDSASLLVL